MSISNIPRGNTRVIEIVVTGDNGAVDITNDDVNFIVKQNKKDLDSAAILNLTNSVGNHTDPTNGVTSFTLLGSDTDITPRLYYYEITHIDSSANVRTLVSSSFSITGTLKEPL